MYNHEEVITNFNNLNPNKLLFPEICAVGKIIRSEHLDISVWIDWCSETLKLEDENSYQKIWDAFDLSEDFVSFADIFDELETREILKEGDDYFKKALFTEGGCSSCDSFCCEDSSDSVWDDFDEEELL